MHTFEHVPTDEQLAVRALSLEALIDGARRGLDAHVGELQRRFGDRLFTRLYADTPTDAGEIVNDAFMALPRLLDSYQEEGRFEAWLLRVGFNLQRTRIRSRNRRRDTPGLEHVVEHPSPRLTGRSFDGEEARRHLVGRLPRVMREVWELSEAGHSHAEIAAKLGITPQNSATIKFRAKQMLEEAAREWLAEGPAIAT